RLQGDWSSDVCSSDLLGIEAVAKSLFVRFVERFGASRGVALHLGGKLRFVHFVGGGDMQDLALQIHGGANLLEKIGAQDAIDFASAGLPNGGKVDRGQSKFCDFGAPDFKALDADFLSVG